VKEGGPGGGGFLGREQGAGDEAKQADFCMGRGCKVLEGGSSTRWALLKRGNCRAFTTKVTEQKKKKERPSPKKGIQKKKRTPPQARRTQSKRKIKRHIFGKVLGGI